jgi:anti-sigma regulatory factor (Ser/Thr protein kinase)
MNRKLAIVLENKLEELSVLTQILQVFLRPYQMPSATLYALELTLEEILVNIISYAYTDETPHDIEFNVEVDANMIAMKFIDGGTPFNPLTVKKAETDMPLMERGIGGLGINVVRQMRDMMEYQRKDDKNILRIWFQREQATD